MENIFEEHLDKTALDLVFKNMEDAVCVTNKHGIIYYMNEAASTLLSADGRCFLFLAYPSSQAG